MDRELLLERLERLAIVLDDMMPRCAELVRDALALLKEQEAMHCKNCRSNHQCAIQFKFADADDEENWFCADWKRKKLEGEA